MGRRAGRGLVARLVVFSTAAVVFPLVALGQATGPVLPDLPHLADSETFVLNYLDADIREVIRVIAMGKNVTILADQDVQGRVSAFVPDATVEKALDAITEPYGFTWSVEDGVYRIRRRVENPYVLVRDGRLTVHADNVPLGTFLDRASRATGLNLVTEAPINQSITAHLTNEPMEAGVVQALRVNNLAVSRDGSVYRVAPAKPPVTLERRDDGTLVLDAQRADIRDVFAVLGRQTGQNILVDVDVSVSNVTLHVEQARFTEVLDAVTATYGLAWQRLGNLHRVYRPAAGVQLPVQIDDPAGDARVSFDLRGAKLEDIVRQIAIRMSWNSVFYVSMGEQANQRVDRLPVFETLDLLFENTPYAYVLDTSTTPAPTLLVGNPTPGSREAGLFLREVTYPVRYARASDLTAFLPRDVPSGNLRVDDALNAFVLSGTPKMHTAMRAFLDRRDTAPPQIVVEMLVVEVNRERANSMGLQTTSLQGGEFQGTFSPTGAPNLSFTVRRGAANADQITSAFTALEREGVAKIHANPKIRVRNNQTASFAVTREDNFLVVVPTNNPSVSVSQQQKIPSGITLNVTPWTGLDDEVIRLNISGEVSSASGQASATQLPTVSARRANTQVDVRDGEMIEIGGLIQRRENEASDRIPPLGRLPILRWIFGNDSWSNASTELRFYIRPRVVQVGADETEPATIGDAAAASGGGAEVSDVAAAR